jgi:dihydropteroate synthase
MKAKRKELPPLRFANGTLFELTRTRVMGILNTTPDSFSDGGLYVEVSVAIERALEMIEAGADIIDIGGESTRPGSESVSFEEQIHRTRPVIEGIRAHSDVPISIDTTSSKVAQVALSSGASMINDISAFRFDEGMVPLIAETGVPAIAMHTLGRPREMQLNPSYHNVVEDVRSHLQERLKICEASGVELSQIVLDPGIGFGKELAHNLALLRHLDVIKEMGHAVLIGTSRKSFLGQITGKDVKERAEATASSVSASIVLGADIVRVHDVKGLRDTVLVADAIRNGVHS